jgi:hypothetical protein
MCGDAAPGVVMELDPRFELVAVGMTSFIYWGLFSLIGMRSWKLFVAMFSAFSGAVFSTIFFAGTAMFVWEAVLQLPVTNPTSGFLVFGYIAAAMVFLVATAFEHLEDQPRRAWIFP